MKYRISINLEPEVMDDGSEMYFWCVLGQDESEDGNGNGRESGRENEREFDCGHGWSSGVLLACECAREWWEKCLKEKDEE